MAHLLGRAFGNGSHAVFASIAAASAAFAGSRSWSTSSSCQKAGVDGGDEREDSSFRVEVHFMDKIQQKAYLTSARDGIPSTLRILAIDLPEMRTEAFSGDCRLAHDRVFVDDVAPPKVVSVGEGDDDSNDGDRENNSKRMGKRTKPERLRIAQKALVKSLVQCQSSKSQHRVGIELLEASLSDLNRYRLRRTHQFGSFKYDPGKYYDEAKSRDGITSGEDKITDHKDGSGAENETSKNSSTRESEGKASFEDELEAPWNQYAWAEEMRLRISGQVAFDAPLEKSSYWNQYLFGQSYRITVHPVSRLWEWPLPTFAQSDPDGVDGRNRTNCRACNKPHAVIANGAALQLMPSSLRLLQKVCKKADVPLFVIHDPRVWGGNTHETLPEALKDMRGTIKNRIISQALKQQGSTAFTRGRMLGQIETEAKWQVREQKRKSRELFDGTARRQRKIGDWSQLDSTRLEKRLQERGVIKETTASDGEGSSIIQKFYSDALVDLAMRCISDVEERKQQEEQEMPSVSQSSPEEPAPESPASDMSPQPTTVKI